MLKHMRLVSTDDHVIAYFDRTFQNNICNFDVQDYIKFGGQLPLRFSILALESTLKELNSYCSQRATEQYNNNEALFEQYSQLAVTYWNAFVERTIQDMIERLDHNGTKKTSSPKMPPIERLQIDSVPKRRPSGVVTPSLKEELESLKNKPRINIGKHACHKDKCNGCIQIFQNAPLMECSRSHPNSPACTKTGWYPHLPSKAWHALKSAHEREDFVFRPRYPGAGERRNPLRTVDYSSAHSARVEPKPRLLGDFVPSSGVEDSNPGPSRTRTEEATQESLTESWSEHVDIHLPQSPDYEPLEMPPSPHQLKKRPHSDVVVITPKRRTIQQPFQ